MLPDLPRGGGGKGRLLSPSAQRQRRRRVTASQRSRPKATPGGRGEVEGPIDGAPPAFPASTERAVCSAPQQDTRPPRRRPQQEGVRARSREFRHQLDAQTGGYPRVFGIRGCDLGYLHSQKWGLSSNACGGLQGGSNGEGSGSGREAARGGAGTSSQGASPRPTLACGPAPAQRPGPGAETRWGRASHTPSLPTPTVPGTAGARRAHTHAQALPAPSSSPGRTSEPRGTKLVAEPGPRSARPAPPRSLPAAWTGPPRGPRSLFSSVARILLGGLPSAVGVLIAEQEVTCWGAHSPRLASPPLSLSFDFPLHHLQMGCRREVYACIVFHLFI